MKLLLLLGAVLFLGAALGQPPSMREKRVPAFTGYAEPEPEAMRFSEEDGITGWSDAAQSVSWFGHFPTRGTVQARIGLRLAGDEEVRLRLTVAGKVREVTVRGKGDGDTVVDFGVFALPQTGYHRLRLDGVARTGKTFGNIRWLALTGDAAETAHFNLKERRNCASVHLGYPVPDDAKIVAFYNEVTVKTDPIWSYYMACGFRRGYFGIQVNSPTERRVIFSIWDSGNEAVDRDKVAAEDRVQLLAKGQDVYASGFGNEGTGGHSHLKYLWKTGETHQFLVTAFPKGGVTVYSGYYFFPDKKEWGLIARFQAPKDGNYLRGLYSFNENFWGGNGQKRRLAEFGNQWVMTEEGMWTELTEARFTHDPTGKEDRRDYSAGTAGNRFFLANGGFKEANITYGSTIRRPATGQAPRDIPPHLLKPELQQP
ncbi:MAG: hypothetical protein OHK0029_24770 [Armatimonadaceae bacterium]